MCLHGSEGGGHCFADKWSSPSPPLTFSILGANGRSMQCGWLEVRAISVAGDSRMQTQNYCVFTVHSPCPHSNQIAGQMTSSSGVECESGEKWMKDEANARLCVCMHASNHAAVHLVSVQQTLSKIGSIIISSPIWYSKCLITRSFSFWPLIPWSKGCATWRKRLLPKRAYELHLICHVSLYCII